MTFPDTLFQTLPSYFDAYRREQRQAFEAVDNTLFEAAAGLIEATYINGHTVFVCGNGGSAAIANHMVCDHGKLVQTDTNIHAKIISLCNSSEMLTAIGNDISFDDVFAYPLRSLAEKGDVLLTISGSGESENIIKAIEVAKKSEMKVIAFTGFSGGKSAVLADVNVHVASDNYGIIEDIHQSLMQIIAQFIRMKNMAPELISERRF